MGWVEDLAGTTVGLDTSPFIYYVEANPVYMQYGAGKDLTLKGQGSGPALKGHGAWSLTRACRRPVLPCA